MARTRMVRDHVNSEVLFQAYSHLCSGNIRSLFSLIDWISVGVLPCFNNPHGASPPLLLRQRGSRFQRDTSVRPQAIG